VPFDREDTLKKAEKLLRQGRLDAAIAEYVQVIEDQPRDWNTANTLGDLYSRAGQTSNAVAQYTRIADHFMAEGFYPKAAALYKKVLKISPDEEAPQLNLAEISAKQGLLVDAKGYFAAIAARRRARGDRRGADEIVVRLGTLDPSDIDARLAAARVLGQSGDAEGAAKRFRALHDDLMEKGRRADAVEALREAVRFNPEDREGRAILARAAVDAGDTEAARTYLDRATAGDDPALLTAFLDITLRSGDFDQARELLPQVLALDHSLREKVVELAWTLASVKSEAAFICVDAVVDAYATGSDFVDAAAVLQEYVSRVQGQIPALLKLVEICVDGGLEATMYEAQAQLADAYLSSGQAAEARVIAEDLVAREPWEQAHIERFRRSLQMLRIPEPDAIIAERLSGQAPFIATDPFADPPPPQQVVPAPQPPHAVASRSTRTPGPPVSSESERTEMAVDFDVEISEPLEESAVASEPPAKEAAPSKALGGPRSTEIDLTGVLGAIESAPPAPQPEAPPQDLEEVFKDFRDELSHDTGEDEAGQYLKLAETYLEMDMADDAISALRTAVRSPRHRFVAGAMLGRLFKERGEIPHAIEWFERAAEAPAPGAEAGRALLYDLGETLEAAGETARALAVFLELQTDAGPYRDVDVRIDRLSRVQTGG
jgi:tetratricopeptide (TPR) repeat protein